MQKFDYEVYTGNDLGAVYSPKMTRFKVWAPEAESVKLNLYKQGEGDNLIEQHVMKKSVNGTYVFEKQGDCNGIYYTYTVVNHGEEQEAVDPYTKAAGVNGQRGMVINLAKTNPQGFELDGYRNPEHITDAIIYEGSVRDFTMDESSGVFHNGKFLGLTEANTTNHFGEATALDYISDLGITHVQILPAFDFETVDEKNQKAQYNWGYDPDNYNVPEGSYAVSPYDGAVRIQEMKQMVLALHSRGIGVIMDVVFNHTYRRDDSNLQKIVPGYYYRSDETGYTDGSGCGNEVASDRPMVQKLIVDSLIYWAKEYHIDGFRFDLMGVLDIDTMNVIAERLKEIRPDIYLYGEGWNGGPSSLAEEKRAFKASAKKMPGIGMFNDDIRDTIKGSVFYDDHLGFVNGGIHLENALRYGITGAVAHPQVDYDAYGSKPWAKEPGQSINYVSCHDNYTLWDKLSVSCPEASEEKKKAMNRLCAAIVFTSQGVPFIQAGEEFLRSKPLPEKKGFAENSYNMPDAVNSIKWDNIHEYPDMIAYYKGLMELRKAHPVFRMQSEAEMTQNLCFLSDTPENVVAYLLKGKGADDTPENILVIFNGNDEEILYNLPEGKWKILVDDKTAGADGKKIISEKTDVEPLSALVLEKE
ncbi:type I pullulanase [Roseburia sp. OM04-10BH]|uniref:type I pullulanase n=1 Tax=unclassified Roseburia TaxID=2637578 RepID=UPI000E50B259|nr:MULTISPECIES: type I pullulanase [unclassified Roseburia]RGI44547.1 type I pullulanase [Roseburia sp. OM04-10BH]RHV40703.1 type I pullulanase [Roseburia sp. OM04-15AA]RHV60653.1 type I pullulanase [Roseburia sp. OM04-10AA]